AAESGGYHTLSRRIRLFRALERDQDRAPFRGRLELGRPVRGARPGETEDERLAVELVDAGLILPFAVTTSDLKIHGGRLLPLVDLDRALLEIASHVEGVLIALEGPRRVHGDHLAELDPGLDLPVALQLFEVGLVVFLLKPGGRVCPERAGENGEGNGKRSTSIHRAP